MFILSADNLCKKKQKQKHIYGYGRIRSGKKRQPQSFPVNECKHSRVRRLLIELTVDRITIVHSQQLETSLEGFLLKQKLSALKKNLPLTHNSIPFQNQTNHMAKKSMFTSRIGWHENENLFLSYSRFNHIDHTEQSSRSHFFKVKNNINAASKFILTSQKLDNYLEFQRTLWQTNLKNVIHLETCFFF